MKNTNYEEKICYLKNIGFFKACQKWWSELTEDEKAVIKNISNFDRDIFKEITGIEV